MTAGPPLGRTITKQWVSKSNRTDLVWEGIETSPPSSLWRTPFRKLKQMLNKFRLKKMLTKDRVTKPWDHDYSRLIQYEGLFDEYLEMGEPNVSRWWCSPMRSDMSFCIVSSDCTCYSQSESWNNRGGLVKVVGVGSLVKVMSRKLLQLEVEISRHINTTLRKSRTTPSE